MEILTIILSGLLSIASSGGAIADSVAAQKIRSQVISVEEQKVRIDNSPNHSVAQGKLQKVRIATRGARIKPDLRIEALELETDPLDIQLAKLDINSLEQLRASLDKPFQGTVRLVLTEADLNQALRSRPVLTQIQTVLNRQIASKAGSTNIAYQLQNLRLELRPANRLGVNLKLARPKSNFEPQGNSPSSTSRELVMALELGIQLVNGKKIRLINPKGTVNGRPMSSRLLNGFAVGISDRLNLGSLEPDGILARILQLEINEDKIELASFFKLETKNP
jgi:hypothetical protein